VTDCSRATDHRRITDAEPTHVRKEPYPAKLPPRWDQVGYRSVFAAQAPAARPAWAD
jgi:hypothetical protein